jgi:methionyl-tRNA formyltransferase
LLEGQPLKIFQTKRTDESFPDPSGTFREKNGKLYLCCADRALEIVSLQASGKKRMDAVAFLRGCMLDGKQLC